VGIVPVALAVNSTLTAVPFASETAEHIAAC